MNIGIRKKILLGLLSFLVVFFVICFGRMRFLGSTDSVSFLLSRVFSSPVLSVNGQKISYKDYIIASKLTEANIFLKDLIFFKQDKTDCEKILEQLIYREIIKEKAVAYKIKITKEEKTNAYKLFLRQFASKKDASEQIKEKYNINLSDYRYFVIDWGLLVDALEANIAKDENINSELLEKINLISEKIKNGEDFAQLAKEYSQDDMAQNGGDLGWFQRGKMIGEVEEVLFKLEKNEIYSEAIKTLFGYHFVKLIDFKKGEIYPETDSDIRASQILIRKPSAISVAQDMLKDSSINIKLKKLKSCQELIN